MQPGHMTWSPVDLERYPFGLTPVVWLILFCLFCFCFVLFCFVLFCLFVCLFVCLCFFFLRVVFAHLLHVVFYTSHVFDECFSFFMDLERYSFVGSLCLMTFLFFFSFFSLFFLSFFFLFVFPRLYLLIFYMLCFTHFMYLCVVMNAFVLHSWAPLRWLF